MKVLIVASGNSAVISPFVKEQGDSLKEIGLDIDYFLIKGKGITGYLKNYFNLNRLIKTNTYDIIHAHYGLSGLLATFQSHVPVVITFHGSDVNLNRTNFYLSFLASRLSDANIFVHESLSKKLSLFSDKAEIIPCGVNLNLFKPIDKLASRDRLGLDHNYNYVLFSSSFNNKIKNAALAQLALSNFENIILLEMKGYSRKEVHLLMNAVDILIVTSHSETGPLVVKEALACNCPIISTDVGDVKELVNGTKKCYIVEYDAKQIEQRIRDILSSNKKSDGRAAVKHLSLEKIATDVHNVYKRVLQ
jgi:glycosyltransferase involved in cell wall biosynthesis